MGDSIEDAAAERRERLRALKAAKELLTSSDGDSIQQQTENKDEQEPDQEQEQKQDMKFRNYVPRDKQLQENKVAPPTLPKFDDPVASVPLKVNGTEDPIINIAPKKPNWDLRRDVQKKLDKLERRTQKAIIELMQEEEKRRLASAEEDSEVLEED